MVPVSQLSRLLLAVIAVPALAGCAALGLPSLPGSTLMPYGTELVEPSLAPDATADAVVAQGYVASPDGYSFSLPGGWTALDLSAEDGFALADAVATTDPTLGALGRLALEQPGSPRLSMAAMDLFAAQDGGLTPGIVVATMRTRGMDKAAARNLVEGLLAQAPLASGVTHTVEGLPAGDAHRYETILVGDSGIPLHLQAYVFRVGGQSFLVAAVAPEDQVSTVQPIFDEILWSLRFGV